VVSSRRGAENNVVLGIAAKLGTPGSPFPDFFLASFGDGPIEGAFMMTPAVQAHRLFAGNR
jgi:hypothetical protein